MKYLKDAWYVIGFASELEAGGSFGRVIAGRPLLAMTDGQGQPKVVQDRCPHRFAPLSKGVIADGVVQCPYHGLKFDGDGKCVENPHGPIVEALSVPAYPAVVRHSFLWAWLGRAEAADPALIPDLSFVESAPLTARSVAHLKIEANYELCSDNIMDLTHADYIHAETLGGGAISRTRPTVVEQDDAVTITWACTDEWGPPIVHQQLPHPDRPADMKMEVCWRAPGIMRLEVRLHSPGTAESEDAGATAAHIMIPETETSTHYFFTSTRTYRQHDEEFNRQQGSFITHIFETEDKPILEDQQARMTGPNLWENKPVLLQIDSGAVRARRVLDRLIAQSEAVA